MAKVQLTWTDNANNEDGVRVYRYRKNSWKLRKQIAQPDLTAYLDKGGKAGDLYRVTAYNVAGESDYSNEAEAS